MARTVSFASSVALALAVVAAPTAAHAAIRDSAPPPPPLLVAAAMPDTPIPYAGQVFLTKDVWVQLGHGAVTLTGSADGDVPIAVDDEVDVAVCDADGGCADVLTHDFSGGCMSGIEPGGPFTLNGGMPTSGVAHLRITLRDLCGGVVSNSDIYVAGVPAYDHDITGDDTPCLGNPLKSLKKLAGSPVFVAAPGKPTVVDGKLQGTGSVDVTAKNNCSAQMRVSLETKTCRPDGTACGPKTLRGSAWNAVTTGTNPGVTTASCRSGMKFYRVQVSVRWLQLEDGDLVRHQEGAYGPDDGWLGLSC